MRAHRTLSVPVLQDLNLALIFVSAMTMPCSKRVLDDDNVLSVFHRQNCLPVIFLSYSCKVNKLTQTLDDIVPPLYK